MTAPRNTPPRHVWDALQRLRACNKQQLADALGVSRQTLARWIKLTETDGDSAGKGANERAAQLMQATLEAGNCAQHAPWRLNWDAVHTIAGRK